VSFTVKFTATEDGIFEDSIGVGDPCFFWYKAYVRVNVGTPRILVGRYDFGDVTVDDSKYGMVTVQNIGSEALEIYDYRGPELEPVYEVVDWNSFELNGADPTYEDPWIIKPGVEKIFEVKFTPDVEGFFLDSVVFISNTDRPADTHIDSVGELTGTGIKRYLVADGYDWQRRRIDRPGTFDVAPYPVDEPDKAILLENGGTTSLMITKIIISEDIRGDAFEFDRAALINIVIEGNSAFYVPVKFHPVTTGAHTLRFFYNNSAGSTTETLLRGIGVVPRIESTRPSFGQTEVNASKYLSKMMKITNLSQVYWEYCDSLTITDLIITPKDAIATTITADKFGSKGFRFDQNKLRIMFPDATVKTAETSLPITLQPGEYIEIDGQFVAPRVGLFRAGITTVSDAETETYSVWT
ncbi:MAG: hypothetical protein KAH48_11830, partial [Chlorobi bacterium]|nr:hypothetical protein [Chlorobiota bacterium]